MSDFLFCFNSIMPVFLVVILGYLFRRIGFFGENFLATADKLVFNVALPAMLFSEISSADFTKQFSPKLTVFCVVAVIAVFLVFSLAAPIFIKNPATRGAFIQGVYRSNFAILGIPLAANLFGEAGSVGAAILMPFVVPLYNVFAVVILAVNMPSEQKLTHGQLLKRIIKNIVTNPLIISVVLALPFAFFRLELPVVAAKTVGYLADMSTPVALLSLGANFEFTRLKGSIGYAFSATFIKILAVPAAVCTAAILIGFRGVELGLVLIMFGGPTAVSSYIMAKQMRSDYMLASQIILLTTLICAFTLFLATFVLKTFGFI